MAKKTSQQLFPKEIKELFNQQTTVILDAVDEKVKGLERRFDFEDKEMLSIKKRLDEMEIRINQKIDKLTTTLDKFLKRLTDIEDEFVLMKADLKRVKAILKEKLGVALD